MSHLHGAGTATFLADISVGRLQGGAIANSLLGVSFGFTGCSYGSSSRRSLCGFFTGRSYRQFSGTRSVGWLLWVAYWAEVPRILASVSVGSFQGAAISIF